MADMIYIMLDVHTINFLRQARGYSTERIAENLLTVLQKLVS